MIMFLLKHMTTNMVHRVHNRLVFIRMNNSNRNPAAAAKITSSFVAVCVSLSSIPSNPSSSQIRVRTRGASSPMPPANTSWSSSARHRRESAKHPSRPTPVRRLSQPVCQQDPADIQKQCRNQDSSVHVASPTPSAPVSSSFIEPTVWRSTWGSVGTGVDLPTTAPRPS